MFWLELRKKVLFGSQCAEVPVWNRLAPWQGGPAEKKQLMEGTRQHGKEERDRTGFFLSLMLTSASGIRGAGPISRLMQ